MRFGISRAATRLKLARRETRRLQAERRATNMFALDLPPMDIYLQMPNGIRAALCEHYPPCLAFRCQHPRHSGTPWTPWCQGHDRDEIDRLGNWCDSCWYDEHTHQQLAIRGDWAVTRL